MSCLFRASSTAVLALALAVSAQSGAIAAQNDRSSAEAKREALFERVLANPADLELSLEYAALSSQAGDYEAAITAMERMLIFAPGLPRIHLEIGVLYYRLRSYAVAQNHLEQVISGNNVPEIVRSRAAKYLVRIQNSQKRLKFTGSLLAGIRYQSNANLAPSSSSVSLNGVNTILNSNNVRKDDASVFTAGSLHYNYDLQRQGDLLEASILFYGAKYANVTNFDAYAAELTLGPSFNLQRFDINNTQLGFYGIGNVVNLDGSVYFATLGAGTRLSHFTNSGTKIQVRAEYRDKNYHATSKRPNVENRDGYRLNADFAFSSPLSQKSRIHGRLRAEREEVSLDVFSYYKIGGELGITTTLMSPFKGSGTFKSVMLFDVTGGYSHAKFDEPDPVVNAGKKQQSDELFARATLTIPVINNFSIIPQVEYRMNASNSDIYDHNGWTAFIALGKKF